MNAGRNKVKNEGECRVCGGRFPEAAHLWPKSIGSKENKGYDNPDLVVPLDKLCHEELDAHVLELLPFLNRDEEVALVREAGISRAYKRVVAQAYDEF